MVSIFTTATRAACETDDQKLAPSMAYVGQQLAQLQDNESAQVYARGLACISDQFNERQVTLDELVNYITTVLGKELDQAEVPGSGRISKKRSGEVLKALVSGIVAWNRAESGESATGVALNMGALFDFGIVYMQAKQRQDSRIGVIADAATSVSPLGQVPHRLESGKLVIETFLRAVKAQAGDRSRGI